MHLSIDLVFIVTCCIYLFQEIITGLKAKGHNATEVAVGKSVVQGVTRKGDYLYGNSDYRKGGGTAGY